MEIRSVSAILFMGTPFGGEVKLINWGEFPDLATVAVLAGAFASVSRRNHTYVSKIWLTGWTMIVLHFAAFVFVSAPGFWGSLAELVGIVALLWAGILFMWASVPYRKENSSRWMLGGVLLSNTIYIAVLTSLPPASWALTPLAILVGAVPLAIAIAWVRRFNHPLRWSVTAMFGALSIFLVVFQHRPGNGGNLALNAVLFTVYFGCCVHFWYAYFRRTAGAFITIAGFMAWALVFVVGPSMAAYFPQIVIESEAWNLPKYVVAVGMILLLLEDQIEHNRHLALHDHLTALPNRRLFQDRLSNALERARRSNAKAALLVVDLDGFKKVNDTMGHHMGDLVLKHVATTFSARVRRSDTVARTGGDEFSIVLEEPTCLEDAMNVGESLKQILNEPLQLGGREVHVGASVGIAVFPEDAKDMESLCIAADLRMYDAKSTTEHIVFTPSSASPSLNPQPQSAFGGAE
jgi:diguanylate cyclase (GGDEF)-like protein